MVATETSPTLEDAMAEPLDMIDRALARAGVPMYMRPMSAATEFVELCIIKIDDKGDGVGVPPGERSDYITSKWFRAIYRHTEQWYRDRFGAAMDAGRSDGRDAAILIRDTPYLLSVPMTTTEPGTPGESFWLCFHDAVQSGEDVLSWVQHGPVFASLEAKDMKAARRMAAEMATKLRAIHIAFMGMDGSDPKVVELRDAILPNLERAARHLVKADAENVRLAHWDMQMGCELSLKCLTQQRTGTFKETHDLFYLYDQMPEPLPPFARTELSKLPNWEKMAELRYGGGPPVPVRHAFRSYRATLTIVAATTSAFRRLYQFGKAKIHLKRPPWMEEV
jgi:hypothetical protein